jgi:hydroxymethylpyrimidine/phosphomethylpyrimidine kinase
MIGIGRFGLVGSMGRKEEEEEVMARLGLAVKMLTDGMMPALLPGSGANIGYALRGARRPEDIASVVGGIVEADRAVHAAGLAFGTGEGVSRVILTAMRTDPGIRSSAMIRFSPAILAVIGDLLLETCEFDPTREPPGVSTMEWGVASCCRDGVPDVIFDRGMPGKEGLIRILGEEPVSIAQTLVALSARLPPA